MVPYERQQRILEILKEKELVKIDELHLLMPNVSMSTLRRDIKGLEASNEVMSLSGGAIRIQSKTAEIPISTKSTLHVKEKKYIAKLAVKQIKEEDTVYVDSGSTCTFLLEALIKMNINIVTTNTNILNFNEDITANVTLLGGEYNKHISSLSGPLAEENLKKYIFDKSFIGANGIDVKFGITTPSIQESSKKKIICDQTKKTYFLCDSSKYHMSSSVKVVDLNNITIISDKIDEKIAEKTQIIYK
ncbi:DeoR/GlpR transcriptional regulator [Mammaliicoccus vitulinus]|uniref:DeoR/GlpR family DNA-binding transcription regulator n=1 Tax=Mammaliicoccus vitulinus TaxID=71237 RepID=UPI000E69C2C9|nr:DeoR/GlpR family DNA-binding transcription regulator [Mammaliicoccus vitulinus]RIN17725.1 DeoR/GlpR transcriptional regulator [Mammaliicoccus vitulinus]